MGRILCLLVSVCVTVHVANAGFCEDPVPQLRESVLSVCEDGLTTDTCKSLYRHTAEYIQHAKVRDKIRALRSLEEVNTERRSKLTMSSFYAETCVSFASKVTVPVIELRRLAKYLAAHGNAIILDLRTPEEYANGHVRGSKNLDYFNGFFAPDIAKLPRKQKYLLYCGKSENGRSHKTRDLMLVLGFTDLTLLPGTDDIPESMLTR